MAGAVALAGGLVVGRLFDAGAATAALAGLAALGAVSAAVHRRPAPRGASSSAARRHVA